MDHERPFIPGPPKRCPRCGETKPRREFYPIRRKTGRGTVTICPSSRCIPCSIESADEWKRANRAKHLEHKATTRANIKADAERLGIHRAQQEDYRRRQGQRPRARVKLRGTLVPAAPFAAWLRTLGDTTHQISERTGMVERVVLSMTTGERDTVYSGTVEAAVFAAGLSPWDAAQVMPQFAGNLFCTPEQESDSVRRIGRDTPTRKDTAACL